MSGARSRLAVPRGWCRECKHCMLRGASLCAVSKFVVYAPLYVQNTRSPVALCHFAGFSVIWMGELAVQPDAFGTRLSRPRGVYLKTAWEHKFGHCRFEHNSFACAMVLGQARGPIACCSAWFLHQSICGHLGSVCSGLRESRRFALQNRAALL